MAEKTIKLGKTLGAFNYAQQAKVTWKRTDGMEQWAVVRRFAPASQTVRAKLSTMQRAARSKIGKDNTFLTGDYDTEVDLFCEIALVDWYVLDDEDQPFAVADAKLVFKANIPEARELFFKLLGFAMNDENFAITEEDVEADLKN